MSSRENMKIFYALHILGLVFFAPPGVPLAWCQQSNNDLDEKTLHELQEAEQSISHKTVTGGGFWGMQIGDRKSAVIQQLRLLGIRALYPEVFQRILVKDPKDLPRLRDADAIMLFPGQVRVTFSGNQVRSRQILPSVKAPWRASLEAATTREEIFSVLAEILRQNKRAEIGNYAPEAKWINPAALTEGDRNLLEKYDVWEFPRDAQGFWYIRLEFVSGRLTQIKVEHSLIELF